MSLSAAHIAGPPLDNAGRGEKGPSCPMLLIEHLSESGISVCCVPRGMRMPSPAYYRKQGSYSLASPWRALTIRPRWNGTTRSR